MRTRVLAALAVAVLVVASTTGCAQIVDALKPAPIINHVTIAAKVAKPGAALQGTLKSAPADLPLWEGAIVQRNTVTKSSAGKSWSAMFLTADAYSDVSAGTAAGFQKAGWQVETSDLSSAGASTTVLTVSSQSADGVVTISTKKAGETQLDYVLTLSK